MSDNVFRDSEDNTFVIINNLMIINGWPLQRMSLLQSIRLTTQIFTGRINKR